MDNFESYCQDLRVSLVFDVTLIPDDKCFHTHKMLMIDLLDQLPDDYLIRVCLDRYLKDCIL